MHDVKLINIKEEILAENKDLADDLRNRLQGQHVFLVNLMSSPGSGNGCSVCSFSSMSSHLSSLSLLNPSRFAL